MCNDVAALAVIGLVPLFVALPQLLGFFHANPMLYDGSLGINLVSAWVPGSPYIDPNVGFTAQALGELAVNLWRQGTIPWWNSYSGVGLPLAAEYQSAVFSPLTLILLFPNGIVWLHLALQVLMGWGFYALSRQLGLGDFSAMIGGILLAECGTSAWFGVMPTSPSVFLPWLLFGIERAIIKTSHGWRQGWRLIALATALILLAGFPETAYICFLFVGVWTIFRLFQIPVNMRFSFGWRVFFGGILGLAISAPQILCFVEFLPLSLIGGHVGTFKHLILGPLAMLPSLLAPYEVGPVFAYQSPEINQQVWDNIGGYVDSLELTIAAYGLWRRGDRFSWMLAVWSLLAISRTFGIQPFAFIWRIVPGISEVMFCRYATPTWEFAILLLATFGVDAMARDAKQKREAVLAAGIVFVVTASALLIFAAKVLPYEHYKNLFDFTLISSLWGVISSALAVVVLVRFTPRWRAYGIGFLLVLDATVMFAIPTLSNPRGGTVDTAAIGYLQNNLGLQRFYTLGSIAPNYGAYFNIASINHNYLPVPKLWGDWVQANLDPAIDPILFTGVSRPDPASPSPAAELQSHLPAYEETGVKYVVAPVGLTVWTGNGPRPPKVYSDSLMDIYQLPAPKPYFQTMREACALTIQSRTDITANCPVTATLVRRELFFPGWEARINGHPTPITEQNGLFQSIALPLGLSHITYAYAPPHIIWAWLLMWLGLVTLVAPLIIRRNKPA